eukprot:4693904-Prymnesium_polylepis.1
MSLPSRRWFQVSVGRRCSQTNVTAWTARMWTLQVLCRERSRHSNGNVVGAPTHTFSGFRHPLAVSITPWKEANTSPGIARLGA